MVKKHHLTSKNKYLLSVVVFFSCNDDNNIEATIEKDIFGCTDYGAINFSPIANKSDGSCEFFGCMNPESINFDSLATIDDGNCLDQSEITEGYSYFWNDEFNGDTLDNRFWNIDVWWPGYVNNESQSYYDGYKYNQ